MIWSRRGYWLWMSLHDAYWIGSHWSKPSFAPEIQERAICPHDGAVESMEHILTECESPGQREVWAQAGVLWARQREGAWSTPSYGDILGSPLAALTGEDGKPLSGSSRLFRILVVESAYLIWKLRCARVCGNDNRPFSSVEILNRWTKAMNDRFDLDRALTDKKFGKKALSQKLVKRTWEKVVLHGTRLPDDWLGAPGVLVGMVRAAQQGVG
ncbi:hypothetical protein FPV67DRAFT_1467420 [Lyophyllum atratum]|nr:hypothetical protein FPV67DRAFT_1467420 [Lyophyllum atratum]